MSLKSEKEQLKGIAWKVFRGWVIDSYLECDRQEIINDARSMKGAIFKLSISNAQEQWIDFFYEKFPMKWFSRYVPQIRRIASLNRISPQDIYELYVIASTDFFLANIFGESDTFAHPSLSDEKRLEQAFVFIIAMANEALLPAHREEIKSEISQACQNCVKPEDVMEHILHLNETKLDFDHFRTNARQTIKVFNLVGIADEGDIFRYFKLFLAHRFYREYANVK
ncbi:MAG: hypothetical protein HGA61_04600 [Candidatus Moranbacteria bacterium]|nr:hypothetical protein [Candidatus Moranbacteria bacterium]